MRDKDLVDETKLIYKKNNLYCYRQNGYVLILNGPFNEENTVYVTKISYQEIGDFVDALIDVESILINSAK